MALSKRAIAFINAHREGHTKLSAAKNASIAVKTAQEYLGHKSVQEALKQGSDEELLSITAAAIGSMAAMLEVLRDIALDDTVHHSNRVGAAKSVLELALKLREVAQLEDRVKELEELLSAYIEMEGE